MRFEEALPLLRRADNLKARREDWPYFIQVIDGEIIPVDMATDEPDYTIKVTWDDLTPDDWEVY